MSTPAGSPAGSRRRAPRTDLRGHAGLGVWGAESLVSRAAGFREEPAVCEALLVRGFCCGFRGDSICGLENVGSYAALAVSCGTWAACVRWPPYPRAARPCGLTQGPIMVSSICSLGTVLMVRKECRGLAPCPRGLAHLSFFAELVAGEVHGVCPALGENGGGLAVGGRGGRWPCGCGPASGTNGSRCLQPRAPAQSVGRAQA